MLSLIFSRATKRRVVGLLALGEWGPPTGAITGSVATQQPGQESIASGAVAEPVVHVVGGGGAGGGLWRARLLPHFRSEIPSITGTVSTTQARQVSRLSGEMIDTELEMLTAILLAIA
jgi:hypothetical protein